MKAITKEWLEETMKRGAEIEDASGGPPSASSPKAWPVQSWIVREEERALDVLKHLTDFGIAIAKIEYDLHPIVGLVFPIQSVVFYRLVIRHIFSISTKIKHDVYDFIHYKTPISPLTPGDDGTIKLHECLFVPDKFLILSGISYE